MIEHDEDVVQGSGNVFADAGIPDAEERQRKAPLVRAIRKAIDENGWTQAEAAERMGLRQPEVSRIMRGRLAGFTFERLLCCLAALGKNVDVVITDAPDAAPGTIRVRLSEAYG